MTASHFRNCLLALGLLTCAPAAWATVEHKIVLRVPGEAMEVAPGGTVRIPVSAVIEPGWHIFSASRKGMSQMTVFAVTTPGYGISSVSEEEPHEVTYDWDPSGESKDWQFEGTALFHLEIRAPAGAASGEVTLALTVSYQTCNAEGCIFPDPFPFSIPLRIAGAPGAAPVRETTPGPRAETSAPGRPDPAETLLERTRRALAEGNLMTVFLAGAIGGFLALLTPCVYPMVPITISFFSKQKSTGRAAVGLAAFYAIGIVAIFTFAGVVVSILMRGRGGVATLGNDPWVNLVVGGIFVVFGFSLLGAYDLALPSGLVSRLSGKGKKEGYVGALFLGLLFSITSFACVAPIAGFILGHGASSGSWTGPVVGMIGFSGALALPFFFLGAFPGMLRSLPRSGAWMDVMKHVCGFVELAAALKFLGAADILLLEANLLTRPVVLCLWSALSLAAGLYLLGCYRFHGEADEGVGAGRLAWGSLFLGIGIYFGAALCGGWTLGEMWESFLLVPEGDAFTRHADLVTGKIDAPGGNGEGHAAWLKNDWESPDPDLDLISLARVRAQERKQRIFIDISGPA